MIIHSNCLIAKEWQTSIIENWGFPIWTFSGTEGQGEHPKEIKLLLLTTQYTVDIRRSVQYHRCELLFPVPVEHS